MRRGLSRPEMAAGAGCWAVHSQNAAPHPTGRCDDVLEKVQAQRSSDRGRGGRAGGDTAAQRSEARGEHVVELSGPKGQKGKRGSPVSISASARVRDADTCSAASTTARTNPRWARPRRHSCGTRDALWPAVCERAARFPFLCCAASAQAALDERSRSRRPIALSLRWVGDVWLLRRCY